MHERLKLVMGFVVAVAMLAGCGSNDAQDNVTFGDTTTTVAQPTEDAVELEFERTTFSEDAEAMTTKWRGTFAPDGSHEVQSIDDTERQSYDATTARFQRSSAGESGAFALDQSGHDPLAAIYFSEVVDTQVAALAVALGRQDSRLQVVDHLNRKAWRYKTKVIPNELAGFTADNIDMLVDTRTGLPLKVAQTNGDKPVSSFEVTAIKSVSRPTSFDIAFHEAAPKQESDSGFRVVGTGDQAPVNYAVPRLTEPPTGFQLAATYAKPGTGQSSGIEGSNPPSSDQVTHVYRNGWFFFTSTTRATGSDPQLWTDPWATEGMPVTDTEITVEDGHFAGTTAKIVAAPGYVPHIWVAGSEIVADVAGQLSTAELTAAANSLATP